MEYPEFRRHVYKAGLTIGEFASLMDVKPNSVSDYASRSTVPRAYAVTAVLLGEMADQGLDFRELLIRFGMPIHTDADKPNVSRIQEYRLKAGRRSSKD